MLLMRRVASAPLVAASLLSLSSGCSFLDLGEFDGAPCRVDADCEKATRADGHDPAECKAFICNHDTGYCDRALKGGGELFDGRDNDCDGFIDEGATPPSPEERGAGASAEPTQIAYASNDNETYVAVVHADAKGGDGWVSSHGLDTPQSLDYSDSDPPRDFVHVAMAPTESDVVFATLSRRGDADGIVYLGLGKGTNPFSISTGDLGRMGQPNLLYCGACVGGVKLTGEVDCDERVCEGAGDPAIAALESDGNALQALAAWLTLPSGDAGCSDTSVPLRGLGAFKTSDDRWLNATDSGSPRDLGEAIGAPQVLPGELEGDVGRYLLSFACAEPDLGVCLSEIRVESNVRSETRETHQGLVDTHEPASHVSAQSTPESGGSRLVGLAWREGCDAKKELRFATVAWDESGVAIAERLENAIATAKIADGPHVIFVPKGFTTRPPFGGWLVLWVEDRTNDKRLMAARVSAAGDALISVEELAAGSIVGAFPLPASSADDSLVRYGFFQGSDQGPWPLEVGEVVKM